jgi:hypothetical protein
MDTFKTLSQIGMYLAHMSGVYEEILWLVDVHFPRKNPKNIMFWTQQQTTPYFPRSGCCVPATVGGIGSQAESHITRPHRHPAAVPTTFQASPVMVLSESNMAAHCFCGTLPTSIFLGLSKKPSIWNLT